MQPALACPSIGSSPPPWTAALLPLDWRLIGYPLLAMLACFALSARAIRRAPVEARGKMKPWLIAASTLLVIATSLAAFSLIVLGGRWIDMVLQWRIHVISRPGFLDCQYAEVGNKLDQALSSGNLAMAVYLGLIVLAMLPLKRAESIRDAALAERSPDIPSVPR